MRGFFQELEFPWSCMGASQKLGLQQSLDVVEFEVEIPHFVGSKRS